jgi:tetratricopeptide (TPR) repeat protein
MAAVLTMGGQEPERERANKPARITVTERETLPGTTVVDTITAPAPAPAPETSAAPAAVSVDEAVARTDQATGYLTAGDWQSAWQAVKPALAALRGTYRDDFRYEAYANYDSGKALAELGRCDKALVYLNRSEALQGSRPEIDDAQAVCGA